MIQHQ